MIEQVKTFKGNALAFEVIDDFTETDEKLAQKFVKEKMDERNKFNTDLFGLLLFSSMLPIGQQCKCLYIQLYKLKKC